MIETLKWSLFMLSYALKIKTFSRTKTFKYKNKTLNHPQPRLYEKKSFNYKLLSLGFYPPDIHKNADGGGRGVPTMNRPLKMEIRKAFLSFFDSLMVQTPKKNPEYNAMLIFNKVRYFTR